MQDPSQERRFTRFSQYMNDSTKMAKMLFFVGLMFALPLIWLIVRNNVAANGIAMMILGPTVCLFWFASGVFYAQRPKRPRDQMPRHRRLL